MTRYRLHFRSGGVSAWDTNKERAYADAKFFHADVEVWDVEADKCFMTYWNGRPW